MPLSTQLLWALGGSLVGAVSASCARWAVAPGAELEVGDPTSGDSGHAATYVSAAAIGALFMFFLAPQCKTGVSAILGVTFLGVLLVVAIGDWRVRRIPNGVVVVGAGAALGLAATGGAEVLANRILTASLTGAIMTTIYVMGATLFRREAMGVGDIKLGAMLGCYLDLDAFLSSLWLAALIGLILGLCMNWLKRMDVVYASENSRLEPWSGSTELPFGSCLCVSSAIVFLFGDTLLPTLTSILVPE